MESIELTALKAKYERLAEEGIVEQETYSDIMRLIQEVAALEDEIRQM